MLTADHVPHLGSLIVTVTASDQLLAVLGKCSRCNRTIVAPKRKEFPSLGNIPYPHTPVLVPRGHSSEVRGKLRRPNPGALTVLAVQLPAAGRLPKRDRLILRPG